MLKKRAEKVGNNPVLTIHHFTVIKVGVLNIKKSTGIGRNLILVGEETIDRSVITVDVLVMKNTNAERQWEDQYGQQLRLND